MSARRQPERSSPITRRKFTLPEHLDEDLQQLAAQYYQDNVSLCLRTAIEDHTHTLNGEGRIAMKRLEQEMSHLHELVATLVDETATIAADVEKLRTDTTHGLPLGLTSERFGDTQQVLDEFCVATVPLRIEDVIERTALSPRRVIHALEQLIDVGVIVATPSGTRYQRSMMQPPTTQTDE